MNLFSLAKEFPTEESALEYWIATRWPNGVRCVKCDSGKVYRIQASGKTGKPALRFECSECGLHFTPTAGTLFHDSHLPLQKWFMAIALMCEAKKGVSANQLSRHLGVGYKTAWYLAHRIRKAMSEPDTEPFGSQGQIIEVDESFIGGVISKEGSTQAKRRKVKVLGIAEHGGRVRLKKIKDLKPETIKPILDAVISPDAPEIRTDGSTRYKAMIPKDKLVQGNHTKEIKAGIPLSNPMVEGAFSLFKRGIIGSYHKIGQEHMNAYLGEFCWRYNRRKRQPELFDMALKSLGENKPLPYEELKGGDDPF